MPKFRPRIHQTNRAILLAGAASLCLMHPAFVSSSWAASFTVAAGATDTTAKTVNGGDTGTVGAGATLSATNAITWALATVNTAPVVINNSGTITGATRGIATSGNAAPRSFTFNNLTAASVLNGTGNDGWQIGNDIGAGTVTVNNAGTIKSAGGQALDFAAITSSTATVVINNAAGATISSSADDAVRPGTGNVTINNQGTIQSTAAAARGININPTNLNSIVNLSIVNGSAANSAALIQSAGDTVRITAGTLQTNAAYTIALDNFGTIKSIGTGANNGQALDFNDLVSTTGHVTITNEASGLIQSADADAIRPGNATVINYGQIISLSSTPGVTGNASGNDAIDFQSSTAGGTVTNMAGGVINGAKSGITGKYAPTITNAGTIIGSDGSGINIDTSLDAAPVNGPIANTGITTIVNTGTIIGNAVSADGDAIDVDYLANITNSGTIRAVGIVAPAVGSLNEALAIGGGTVLNNAGGLIISDQRAITVDDSNLGPAYGAATIDNFGTITGNNGQAININSTSANILTNETGGVINGSVVMGAGTDTVNLFTGSTLNGTLDGGAGSDSLVLKGSGTGSFANVSNFEILNVQGGAWTLTGAQAYATSASVTGGTLNVAGTLTSPTLGIASGATLTGTGRVGTTSIAGGGTFNPGNGFAVAGNLSLASGSNYIEAVTPTAANLTTVTGTASLNGALTANLAAGGYAANKRYTVLTATGGVSGSFASVAAAAPAYVKPTLSYDASNVYLTLTQVSLASNLSGGTLNQKAVTGAIDTSVAGGFIPTGGTLALYGLSGAGLNGAVDQISGQINANVSNAVGESALSFLSMITPGDGIAPGSYAPGQAYGGADAPSRAQLGSGEAKLWGMVYGGTADLDGDATNGAASLSASNYGFAIGVDTRLDANLLAGLTVAVGHQDFSSGNGAGNSDDVLLGGYFRESLGNAYFAGSVVYGWHSITTSRVVTVSGTDVLNAGFDAHDIGGRIEAGWRMPLQDFSLTPYGAWTRTSFDAPAYGETAASGASTFALSYAARTTAVGRTELGARLGRDFGWDDGALTASLKAAWAHQLDDAPTIQAAFTGLPSSGFQVIGTHAGADSAILGGELKAETQGGLSYGVKLESQLGQGTTIFEGMGELAWRW